MWGRSPDARIMAFTRSISADRGCARCCSSSISMTMSYSHSSLTMRKSARNADTVLLVRGVGLVVDDGFEPGCFKLRFDEELGTTKLAHLLLAAF